MEKKVYLWISLIVGVPIIRLVEIASIGWASRLYPEAVFKHIALGLMIGIGCVLTTQMLNLSGKKLLWILPMLTLGYAALLLTATYGRETFEMDGLYVATLFTIDLSSWAIAVAGATFIGLTAMKPRLRTKSTVIKPT